MTDTIDAVNVRLCAPRFPARVIYNAVHPLSAERLPWRGMWPDRFLHLVWITDARLAGRACRLCDDVRFVSHNWV